VSSQSAAGICRVLALLRISNPGIQWLAALDPDVVLEVLLARPVVLVEDTEDLRITALQCLEGGKERELDPIFVEDVALGLDDPAHEVVLIGHFRQFWVDGDLTVALDSHLDVTLTRRTLLGFEINRGSFWRAELRTSAECDHNSSQ